VIEETESASAERRASPVPIFCIIPMSLRVSAVVVSYQQRDLLRSCLESLREAVRVVEDGQEIIVVDNGSSDGSGDMMRKEFPEVRLIELPENAGFAGGVSVGIQHAKGDWILCVNNDATVAPDAIEHLLHAAESGGDEIGSVAAQMVFADQPGIINSAGIVVDRLGVASDRLLGEPVRASEQTPVEVFGTSAGAGLYRRSMLEEVPFDETFFAYLEDVDVAWRARMRGWRCVYVPAAVVRHQHSMTAVHGSPFKYYWTGRNRVRVLAKNATLGQLVRFGLAMLVFDLAYVGFVLVRDRSLMPVRGRIDGLRSWRADRRAAAPYRHPVELPFFLGFRAALRRAGRAR
jgi:GT2 family glycosyltransferase